MMGTDKKQISTADLPPAFEELFRVMDEVNTKDKEEKFLQLAAAAYNYRQCGTLPARQEITMSPAPAEEKEYCSAAAFQVLRDIISEESMPLFQYWLQRCYEKQQVAPPDVIPTLLKYGTQYKKLQFLIAACCGNRGQWLSRFNAAWNFSTLHTEEDLWQTGTLEQRKETLRQTRKTDPAKAREWVQQTWPREDAGTKAGFLEIMKEDSSADDIPFLESLSTDKSKKVREQAMELLKQIPGSSIVLLYEKALSESVILKKEKALLGIVSKMVLQCKLPASFDEQVYKTGIDKLSNSKELTDDEYVISQLMESVPPVFWERNLETSPEKVIELFQKDASGKKLIPALVNSITKFRDNKWALHFMQYSEVFYIDIIPLLHIQYQEVYSNKFFDKYPDAIIQHASERETEWSVELAVNIFSHGARYPYRYNNSFYNQHIHLVPAAAVFELAKCAPSEDYMRNTWNNTSEYIGKLITLKSQTIKAFNS